MGRNRGFIFVEAVLGVCFLALLSLALLEIYGYSWQIMRRAVIRQHAFNAANAALAEKEIVGNVCNVTVTTEEYGEVKVGYGGKTVYNLFQP